MARAPGGRQGGPRSPKRACTARATNPDSPYRKRKASTPTKGGSTAGSAISEPRALRPGNSSHSNRNASGTPIAAASATLASEIHRPPPHPPPPPRPETDRAAPSPPAPSAPPAAAGGG